MADEIGIPANRAAATQLPASQRPENPERRRRLREMALWFLTGLAFIVLWLIYFYARDTEYFSFSGAFFYKPAVVFISVAFWIIPVVFDLIFAALPFEILRQSLQTLDGRRSPPLQSDALVSEEQPSLPSDSRDDDERPPVTAEWSASEILASNAETSLELSEGIYRRSGVYLFIGVLIAFLGLFFFYTTTPPNLTSPSAPATSTSPHSMWDFMNFLPRLGILLFIELIAFFFLRQYRAAMDEFRYFEAVKRRREEVQLLFALSREAGEPIDLLRVAEAGCFFSDPAVLSTGQTTEIIETRKLEKNEVAVLEKVIDALSASKR